MCKRKTISTFLIVLSAMILSVRPAFAIEGISEWREVYQIARAVAIPIAALSFAFGGMSFFGFGFFSSKSGDKQVEIGKKMMLYSVLGVIALYLLPLIIGISVNIFQRFAWDPGSPSQATTPNRGNEANNPFVDMVENGWAPGWSPLPPAPPSGGEGFGPPLGPYRPSPYFPGSTGNGSGPPLGPYFPGPFNGSSSA